MENNEPAYLKPAQDTNFMKAMAAAEGPAGAALTDALTQLSGTTPGAFFVYNGHAIPLSGNEANVPSLAVLDAQDIPVGAYHSGLEKAVRATARFVGPLMAFASLAGAVSYASAPIAAYAVDSADANSPLQESNLSSDRALISADGVLVSLDDAVVTPLPADIYNVKPFAKVVTSLASLPDNSAADIAKNEVKGAAYNIEFRADKKNESASAATTSAGKIFGSATDKQMQYFVNVLRSDFVKFVDGNLDNAELQKMDFKAKRVDGLIQFNIAAQYGRNALRPVVNFNSSELKIEGHEGYLPEVVSTEVKLRAKDDGSYAVQSVETNGRLRTDGAEFMTALLSVLGNYEVVQTPFVNEEESQPKPLESKQPEKQPEPKKSLDQKLSISFSDRNDNVLKTDAEGRYITALASKPYTVGMVWSGPAGSDASKLERTITVDYMPGASQTFGTGSEYLIETNIHVQLADLAVATSTVVANGATSSQALLTKNDLTFPKLGSYKLTAKVGDAEAIATIFFPTTAKSGSDLVPVTLGAGAAWIACRALFGSCGVREKDDNAPGINPPSADQIIIDEEDHDAFTVY